MRWPLTAEERFWTRVNKDAECWLWTGCVGGTNGYGRIYVDGRLLQTHRYSWMLVSGSVPDGMAVCHRCDVPRCVRPNHLFLGTQRENLIDMRHKGRAADPKSAIGEAHHLAKLTECDVLRIRELYPELKSGAIAKQFGVSKGSILSVLNGKTWKHVGITQITRRQLAARKEIA